MSTDAPPREVPLGTIALLIAAAVLYLAMLSTVSFSAGGGDAVVGQALASFFATVALWVALAVLLVAAGVTGEMPRWAGFAAVVLLPFAGVATFVAIDMCSRRMGWAIVFVVLLPLAVAGYAVGTRFARARAGVSAQAFSLAAWGFVLVLSALACGLGAVL